LNEIGLYVTEKERGQEGANKRCWGIEMNEAEELYLNSYYVIDWLDLMIKNCFMSYR
jgi:hypothetical protein